MKKISYRSKAALLLFSCVSLTTTRLGHASKSELDQNKRVVTHFYEMAFNDKKPEEAVKKFVGLQYIQHNPFVADGKKPFIDFFVPYLKDHPQSRITIKRVIAEREISPHSMSTLNSPPRSGTCGNGYFSRQRRQNS